MRYPHQRNPSIAWMLANSPLRIPVCLWQPFGTTIALANIEAQRHVRWTTFNLQPWSYESYAPLLK